MSRRIPHNAFEFYVALGLERSYARIAEHFGMTKRAVTKHAASERWSARSFITRDGRRRLSVGSTGPSGVRLTVWDLFTGGARGVHA